MKGVIITVKPENREGLIVGENGKYYKFNFEDWGCVQELSEGIKVNFFIKNSRALPTKEYSFKKNITNENIQYQYMLNKSGVEDRKLIHCTNCNYEGEAKKVSDFSLNLIAIVLLILGMIYLWPLIVVAIILFVAASRKSNYICPVCNWKNPIPLDYWKEKN